MLSDAFQFLFCIQNPAGMRNECGCDQLKQLQGFMSQQGSVNSS